ncbi:hypothetical protein B6R96_36490 (plasmid) [Streptomyces sp. Sge12]|nr:hypothetical protein B6R96_36490 [Streptomyces sp. Sge12]
MTGPKGAGSGYAVGGRLVLTSAHVAGPTGTRVQAFPPGLGGSAGGTVVWAGTPGGRDDAALAAVQEAVGHYRFLAEANPDAYLPDLAGTLNNLSIDLSMVGRREEGLAAVQDAVGHYSSLAEANPDLFGPALQQSLDMTAWLEGLKP